PFRQCHELRPGSRAYLRRRLRKALADIEHADAPAKLHQPADDAAVLGGATGRGGEVPGGRGRHPPHPNRAPDQARAVRDSAMVMRIALSSRPSRPSLPARAASASASKTCLVRNSVVVLTLLNSSSASRFL